MVPPAAREIEYYGRWPRNLIYFSCARNRPTCNDEGYRGMIHLPRILADSRQAEMASTETAPDDRRASRE